MHLNFFYRKSSTSSMFHSNPQRWSPMGWWHRDTKTTSFGMTLDTVQAWIQLKMRLWWGEGGGPLGPSCPHITCLPIHTLRHQWCMHVHIHMIPKVSSIFFYKRWRLCIIRFTRFFSCHLLKISSVVSVKCPHAAMSQGCHFDILT